MRVTNEVLTLINVYAAEVNQILGLYFSKYIVFCLFFWFILFCLKVFGELAASVRLLTSRDRVFWQHFGHVVYRLRGRLVLADLCSRINNILLVGGKLNSIFPKMTAGWNSSRKSGSAEDAEGYKNLVRVEKDFVGWLVCREKHLCLIPDRWRSAWKHASEDKTCLLFDMRSSSLTSRVLPRGNAAFSVGVSLWVSVSQTIHRINTKASSARNTKVCRLTEKKTRLQPHSPSLFEPCVFYLWALHQWLKHHRFITNFSFFFTHSASRVCVLHVDGSAVW